MAERVARVKIQATADLKGFDEASKSLRELQKAVGPADAEIAKVRQEILNFAQANKQSEAVINAQINALKQLKQQASLGGDVYKTLGRDVEKLKQSLGDTGTALQGTARSITEIGKATQSTQVYINGQAKSFEAMRKQANETISTLQNLGRQTDQLKSKGQAGFFSSGGRNASGVFEVGRKGLADVQAYAALVKRLQEQSQTAVGKVARLSEGMFALSTSGVALKGVVDAMGGVSGALQNVTNFTAKASGAFAQLGAGTPQWAGLIKNGLNEISLLLNQPANGLADWSNAITSVQGKLAALNAPVEAFNTALAAIGPEGAAAAGVVAVAFAGMQDAIGRAFKEGEKDASAALQGITDETQQLLRKLAELSQAFRGAASMNELQALRAGAQGRFNETPAGTDASRRAANTIANAEARIRAEGMAQADVLEAARQRYRGSAQDVTSLSERLAYLNQAMKLVDQTTSEGSIEYARFASEADQLKQKIDKLSNSYRTVAQAAADAAKQQGVYANQSTVANYFNRAGVKRNEEIAAAVAAAFAKPQTLALPAAGQTSFTGQYREGGLGGMARANLSNVEIAGTREKIGAPMGSQSQAAELKAMASAADQAETELTRLHRAMQAFAQSQIDKKVQQLSASLMLTGEQSHQAARAYDSLATQIEKVGRSSDTSLNSLRQQRQLWEQLYNSVEKTDPAFKRAAENIQRLDRQIEKRDLGGMRGKVGYIGQGIGAAASAGIFGGPEGLIGGVGGALIGGALGGPAGFASGAFIGSSFGTYASMLRQTIGGAGEYAAEVKRLEIALRGVTTSAEEFAKAQQVIKLAGAELNVPVLEATKGFTQLTAAVNGAGGGVAESEAVFRGVTEAIKATGGGAEEVQGALTAMAQIFSKGKVSAEELSGQLGERLPGAVTLFAQATGRTLPQLQKDLQDGTVGLNDVMKFAVALSDKYGDQAAAMASSTEDSTARMKVALDELRLAFGSIVKPITASIQSVMTRLAEMATRALKSIGIVRDGLTEIGAAGRAKDLQTRAKDAANALGPGVQSENEKRAALRLTGDLLKGVTEQKTLVGVQQNIRALEQALNIVRRISPNELSDKQKIILENYSASIAKRIASEEKLLETIKEQRKFKDFGSADKDKDSEKQSKAAEKLANEQQQLAESTAQAEIRLAESVFKAQTEFDRRRFELQQELIDKERQLRIAALTGAAADAASRTAQLFRTIDELRMRVVNADTDATGAGRTLANARYMESVTGGGSTAGRYIQGGIGPRGANQYGPHFDIKRDDRSYFDRSALDRYVQVNGRPLSSGLTVPGGRYGAARGYGGHAGWDYAFGAGASLTLTGGAKWMGSKKGAYGDETAFMTPDGKVYKILHGKFEQAAKDSGKGTGKAAQQRRNVTDQGDTAIAQVDYDTALKYRDLIVEMTQKQLPQEVQLAVLDGTKAYREQSQALRDNAAELAKKQELELSGARPEIVDGELAKLRVTQNYNRQIEELKYQLTQKEALEDPTKKEYLNSQIAATTQAYRDQTAAIDESTQAQIRLNDAMRFRQDTNIGAGFREGVQQYVESIGTMREAMSQLTVTGIKGVEDALVSLVTTGKANFREFAASILRDTARMIIQQLVLRTIMQAIGAIGGGGGGGFLPNVKFNPKAFSMPLLAANGYAFAQNGIQPFAKGGIVDKPTLFKFANGGAGQLGLMGEAGPEAIMPLRRGRDGKLGVVAEGAGGGSTSVVVNVDASGSSQVSGNAGQAEALGRAVSQAVQAELLRQKRPGGLLAA